MHGDQSWLSRFYSRNSELFLGWHKILEKSKQSWKFDTSNGSKNVSNRGPILPKLGVDFSSITKWIIMDVNKEGFPDAPDELQQQPETQTRIRLFVAVDRLLVPLLVYLILMLAGH